MPCLVTSGPGIENIENITNDSTDALENKSIHSNGLYRYLSTDLMVPMDLVNSEDSLRL